MSEEIKAHFYKYVAEPLNDYLDLNNEMKYKQDIKSAMNAALPLYHFSEHLPSKIFLQQIKKNCPEYRLLGDVVNAWKHKNIDKHDPLVSSLNQVNEYIVKTRFQDDKGFYHHTEKHVMVELNNGATKNLTEILVKVMNFWIKILYASKIIEENSCYELPMAHFPLGRHECNEAQMDLVTTNSFQLKVVSLWQQYNYETGCCEPIELMNNLPSFTFITPTGEKLVLMNKAI